MINFLDKALEKVRAIKQSGLTIYDEVEIGDKKLWLTTAKLQEFLNSHLTGMNLQGL